MHKRLTISFVEFSWLQIWDNMSALLNSDPMNSHGFNMVCYMSGSYSLLNVSGARHWLYQKCGGVLDF